MEYNDHGNIFSLDGFFLKIKWWSHLVYYWIRKTTVFRIKQAFIFYKIYETYYYYCPDVILKIKKTLKDSSYYLFTLCNIYKNSNNIQISFLTTAKLNRKNMNYSLSLQEFIDDGNGNVAGIRTVKVSWTKDETGRWKMDEIPDSEVVSLKVMIAYI